jgi:threonine dehydrogenase-like Zn-dependent dehydrogenase
MNKRIPAVLTIEPHSVEVREIPIPEIGDGDVLLAVSAGGICGSDLPCWRHLTVRPAENPRTLADLDEVALAFGFAPQTLRVW